MRVRSSQGEYEVELVDDVAGVVARVADVKGAMIVVDRRVAALYAGELAPWSGRPVLAIEATERNKSLEGVVEVARWLQANGASRKTTVVAVGGGIVQDIATFAAHVYHRGLPIVLVPTTVLAMADSCIGSKCAINLDSYKNQLGCFQAPRRVLLCVRFADTLADGDVASGFGEILKLAITGSAEHLDDLERAVDAVGLRGALTSALIERSLAVKRAFVEKDELDVGERRVLNYGHTFGHAVESLTDHAVPHGLAVAWGLDLVNHLAADAGMLDPAWRDRIHDFVVRHLRARSPARFAAADLIGVARRDKKAADGAVQLILLERPGRLTIVPTPLDDALEARIQRYLTGRDALLYDVSGEAAVP